MSLQPNTTKFRIEVARTKKNQDLGPNHAHGTHSAATLIYNVKSESHDHAKVYH